MGRKKLEEKPKASRRKKREEEEETDDTESGSEELLGSDVKRGIAAILLIMLGILFLFGYFEAAGPFGAALDRGVGSLFGWGKWLFPVLLSVSALFLLRRRETSLSDVVKFIGLGVVFVAALGFLHLFQGDGKKELLAAARSGEGGGYIGFGIAYVLVRYTGRGAGSVILSALLLSGIVAAFNVSLAHLMSRIRERFSALRRPSDGNVPTGEEDDTEEPSSDVMPTDAVPYPGEAATLAETRAEGGVPEADDAVAGSGIVVGENNIRTISFAEDEDASSDDEEEYEDVADAADPEDELDKDDGGDSPRTGRRPKPRPISDWEMPSVDLFRGHTEKGTSGDIGETERIIQSTLKYFNISGEMGEAVVGPTVTQYTFRPAFGMRLSKIVALSNDLALALARHPIRIEAPIPNTSLVGIEVPNVKPATVRMRNILESGAFAGKTSNLSVVLGEAVDGTYEVADLESMPHLLVAGRTGSGKSVCVNAILLSLLYQNSPEDLNLILVDPKRVELSLYNGIPHLRGNKVITDSKHVVNALKHVVREMERRLGIFEDIRVRNIGDYRERYFRGDRRTVIEDGKPRRVDLEPLPYIVIVIDEMADLMMSHGKEVEAAIVRLAQMSRAAGIHLVLATQKPISDVVTGLIKSNVPAKIAFAVSNQMDSRIILDTGGAEKLVGKGDMLYGAPGAARPKRLQGVYVDDREVKDVVRFLVDQKKERGADELGEDYDDRESDATSAPGFSGGVDFSSIEEGPSDQDELYDEAKRLVIESGRAATTFLQRRLSIGYGRAAKLLDLLEEQGIVGQAEGRNKGRVVLVGPGVSETGDREFDDPTREQAERDKWQI